MTGGKISVFVADDHKIIRDGLKMILESEGDIVVEGEAGNGLDAVRKLLKCGTDIALLDISMPEMNGIEAVAKLKENGCETKAVMLSVHGSKEHILKALRAGARGYLLKEFTGSEASKAVRSVYSGQLYMSSGIDLNIIEELSKPPKASLLDELSPREREVLQLVVEGNSSAQVAQKLNLSPKTVDTYRSRLMAKLGLKNLPELIKFAIRNGIVSIE